MTSESRNSSLLGNDGKHVPTEMKTHVTIELYFSKQRISKYTIIGTILEMVFSVLSVQSGYKEEFI
jgi:hypothetical protein